MNDKLSNPLFRPILSWFAKPLMGTLTVIAITILFFGIVVFYDPVWERLQTALSLNQDRASLLSVWLSFFIISLGLANYILTQSEARRLARQVSGHHKQYSRFHEHIEDIKRQTDGAEVVHASVITSTLTYGLNSEDPSLAFEFVNILKEIIRSASKRAKKITGETEFERVCVHIYIWDREDHKSVFKYGSNSINKKQEIAAYKKLDGFLKELKEQHLTQDLDSRIEVKFFATKKLDWRLFLLATPTGRYGQMDVFTPLTSQNLNDEKWKVSGFSSTSLESYEHFRKMISVLNSNSQEILHPSPYENIEQFFHEWYEVDINEIRKQK